MSKKQKIVPCRSAFNINLKKKIEKPKNNLKRLYIYKLHILGII